MPRPKGSKNKPKRLLISRLEELYGDEFNPIMKMAENAVILQQITDNELKEFGMFVDDHMGEFVSNNERQQYNAHLSRVKDSAVDSINAWDKVAQYTQPKLKAVEVMTPSDERPEDRTWLVEFVNATSES